MLRTATLGGAARGIVVVVIVVLAAQVTSAFRFVSADDATFASAAASFNAAPYSGQFGGAPLSSCVYFANSTADVVAAVRDALGRGARSIQPRSGRHSYSAITATTPGAAIIDVSGINAVGEPFQVPCPPPSSQESEGAPQGPCYAVTFGPGIRLFDAYETLAARHGFMIPGGTCPTVGLGGYVLGGGYGLWSRQHGLGSDAVVAATVVTVGAGKVVLARDVAMDSRDPDDAALLWALRGGGNGNFGVVTSLTLRVFPLPRSVATWRVNFADVGACRDLAFTQYQDTAASVLPRNLTLTFDVYAHGQCSITAVLAAWPPSSSARSTAAVPPLGLVASELRGYLSRYLTIPGASTVPVAGPVVHPSWVDAIAAIGGCDNVTQCSHRAKSEVPDPTAPQLWGAFSSFRFAAISKASLRAVFDAIVGGDPDSGHSGIFAMVIFDTYGGAINRTKLDTETAFVHHTALYHAQILFYLPTPGAAMSVSVAAAAPAKAWRWAAAVRDAIDTAANADASLPAPVPRSYRNYVMTQQADRLERSYGGALGRLRSVKAAVDPLRVFASPESIE